MRLVRGSDSGQQCDSGVGSCDQFDASEEDFSKLQGKYGMNM